MAIYNKGTIKPRPLAGTAASSAQQLATQVATQQSRPPNPNGLNSGKPLDTTGRQEARGPASGPLTAPTGLPAQQTGPRSFTDPSSQPPPDLKGVTLPKPGANRWTGPTAVTGGFKGTPPPVDVKDGKLVTPPPKTDQELQDEAIRSLLEGSKADTAKERAAMQGEMKVAEARDIQSMRARTGLGGMGLTGAAGAMESQVRTEGARKQALTTAEFDRKARQEEMSRTIAGIELKFGSEAADRAREAFDIEKELAKDELGPMRVDFPPGPEGDKAFEDAKTAKEGETATSDEYDSGVAAASGSPAKGAVSGSRLTVKNDASGEWKNGDYNIQSSIEGVGFRDPSNPDNDKGFIMIKGQLYHLYETNPGYSDSTRVAVPVSKPK